MQRIKARDLLCIENPDELKGVLDRKHILVFDDGSEMLTRRKYTYYSRFFWDMQRVYPNTPLLKKHHVGTYLKEDQNAADMNALGEKVYNATLKDAILCNGFEDTPEAENVLDLMFEIHNRINNVMVIESERHLASISYYDFIEITQHPVIKTAIDACEPNHNAIAALYKTIQYVINTDPSIADNSLVIAIKTKMVNINQILQCIGIRGFVTEVDGQVLAVPVMTNYTRGITTLYDLIAESRPGAKSLYFSEAPLQDAEYFARRLQILCMVVEYIVRRDCGSKTYLDWYVSPPKKDDLGNVTYPGDLPYMVGKFFLNEERQELEEITEDSTYLYNRTIKLRSSIYCKEKNPHAVCKVCFGTLSRNVSRFQNLGHLCAATMTQQTSQSVLSNKHIEASSVSANIILSDEAKLFFEVNPGKNAYLLKKGVCLQGLTLVVNKDDAPGLNDILQADYRKLVSSRISNIDTVDVQVSNKGLKLGVPVKIGQDSRKAVMSDQFLSYIEKMQWSTNDKGNFVFDMSLWNHNEPLFRLPDKEYSYSMHSAAIAKLIESNSDQADERAKPGSPAKLVRELFDLVNSKLHVKLSAIEVICYPLMVPSKNSVALARNVPDPVLGVADNLIKYRSAGGACAYEDTHDLLTSPSSYYNDNRPNSVFDAFLKPKEYIEHLRKQDYVQHEHDFG